ncbi:MAG: pyruvate kinase, partial [Olpidium bornovanus]
RGLSRCYWLAERGIHWHIISGTTARVISKYRPDIPVLTVTRNAQTARQCHLYRGCYPFLFEKPRPHEIAEVVTPSPLHVSFLAAWQEDVDARVEWCLEEAKKTGILRAGTNVVVIQGWRSGNL